MSGLFYFSHFEKAKVTYRNFLQFFVTTVTIEEITNCTST